MQEEYYVLIKTMYSPAPVSITVHVTREHALYQKKWLESVYPDATFTIYTAECPDQ